MALTRLHINAFRNIECAQLQPTRGINMLVGENGSGKTSILEAIHYLSVGALSVQTTRTVSFNITRSNLLYLVKQKIRSRHKT